MTVGDQAAFVHHPYPPVPDQLGPARRHHHILEQLSRFFDVSLASVGTPEFHFASPPDKAAWRYAQKVCFTLLRKCDFLAALEKPLRRSLQRCLVSAFRRGDPVVRLPSSLTITRWHAHRFGHTQC
jgi:hypothetical protein